MTSKERSDAIIEWLSDHPLISRNALCNLVGYDVSNLNKAIEGKRSIPEKYLPLFEAELRTYGFRKRLLKAL